MAPVEKKAKEPAVSAPEPVEAQPSMQMVEAVVAAASAPEEPIVLPPKTQSVPEVKPTGPKYFRVKLLKNYRPEEIENGGSFVLYELDDPENDSEDDFEAKRTARVPTVEEWKKVRAGAVIGLQMEEARRVMKLKIAERFDAPAL